MKRTALNRRTPLRVKGNSDTATIKDEIQRIVREIVIARDGGCILRSYRRCTDTVLQADHLITRSNSATYADTRLIVCVCRSCHAWKSLGSNMRKGQYDALVKTIISPDRVALWERCEQESWRPHRTTAYDWQLTIAALKQELARMEGSKDMASIAA